MPERRVLLRRIQELSFAAVELNLFLDNFPNDKQALADYNRISQELLCAKEAYESRFGPLLYFGYSPIQYPCQWVSGPWPWEPQ